MSYVIYSNGKAMTDSIAVFKDSDCPGSLGFESCDLYHVVKA